MSDTDNIIAFFDFDGTITSKDSLACFIQFTVGVVKFYAGILATSPFLAAYKLKLISNHAAKERFVAHYFEGWSESKFKQVADDYSQKHLASIVRPDAFERIQWHQAQGHRIVVVSASLEYWLKKWCEQNNLELIGTQLEFENGQTTGRFASKNCYGQEKVNRIREHYALDEYDAIYAYGDSRGDREMLAISNYPGYRSFTRKPGK